MKKIIFTILFVCLIFTAGVLFAGFMELPERWWIAEYSTSTIEIDHLTEIFSEPIVTISDKTYVPLRELCEKIGYGVEWNGEEDKITLTKDRSSESVLPFRNDMTKSENGELSSGRKYFYTADPDFSVENQIADWALTSRGRPYGAIPTAKLAADIGQAIFGTNETFPNVDDAVILVNFDKKKDAWFVTELYRGTSSGGSETVIIRRSDGRILGRYAMR